MPILTCIFFTFNWLTLTSEMHFVKFHPMVASCLLSRGKRKYAPLGMRLLWKYIRNYFLVYQIISPFLVYLQNYKEFEAEILDLQSEKCGLSFDIKKYTTSGWALGDENVIGIRAFKWPRYFYSRWCPRGGSMEPPTEKTTFPPEFFNDICTIYVWAIKNHNSAKKNLKCCTVSKWRPNNRFLFCIISILAKFWKITFPKEFFNEIWLKEGE